MCLLITGLEIERRRVAKKDIVCYKVLSMKYNEFLDKFVYETPVTGTEVEFNTPLTADDKTEFRIRERNPRDKSYRLRKYFIAEGGFHTYIKKKKAIEMFKLRNAYFGDKGIVVECIIPKGSLYAKGITEGGRKSYVSKDLIITDNIIIRY